MKQALRILTVLVVALSASLISAQEPQKIKGPDERYKVDILVVVAHPDDEGAVTPYLARAIYDLHKSVAGVFGPRGGGGGKNHLPRSVPPQVSIPDIHTPTVS